MDIVHWLSLLLLLLPRLPFRLGVAELLELEGGRVRAALLPLDRRGSSGFRGCRMAVADLVNRMLLIKLEGTADVVVQRGYGIDRHLRISWLANETGDCHRLWKIRHDGGRAVLLRALLTILFAMEAARSVSGVGSYYCEKKKKKNKLRIPRANYSSVNRKY